MISPEFEIIHSTFIVFCIFKVLLMCSGIFAIAPSLTLFILLSLFICSACKFSGKDCLFLCVSTSTHQNKDPVLVGTLGASVT